MAEDGGGGGGAGGDLLFILFVFVFVILAWFLSGAAKNANLSVIFFSLPGTRNPFASTTIEVIEVPSVAGVGTGSGGVVPSSGGGQYDQTETNTITTEVAQVRRTVESLRGYASSPFAGQVTIQSATTGRYTGAVGEYVTLRASVRNKTPVVISGWRIESGISHTSAQIGGGASPFQEGYGNGNVGAIVLNPGDEVIVSTARSPIGVSFQVNKCSGYLSQFQQFTPSLSTNCPTASDDALDVASGGVYNDNPCMDHLDTLSSCRIDLTPSNDLSDACRSFIFNAVTYQGCVNIHRNDADFKQPQWRVFLGYESRLWREKREVLALLDSQGKLVDSTTY